MSAALCALQEAIQRDPKPYKSLIPSFVSILKQVCSHLHHLLPGRVLLGSLQGSMILAGTEYEFAHAGS